MSSKKKVAQVKHVDVGIPKSERHLLTNFSNADCMQGKPEETEIENEEIYVIATTRKL